MKLFALWVALLLLVRAQSEPSCSEIRAALHTIEMAHVQSDADLRSAAATCETRPPHLTHHQIFAWISQAVSGTSGRDRFGVLSSAAKAAFRAGQMEDARAYARELLQMAPKFTREPDYGDAIYDGYCVLGRIALARDNLPLARQYLMNAASTPGSASLSRDGPNMTFAKEMLEKNQSAAVLQFLVQCRGFWKQDGGRLAAWTTAIRSHEIPDFGPNLDN